ncbi:MAG: hypothetical protein RLZZ202_1188, partial [Pseudomonadota bacterium]
IGTFRLVGMVEKIRQEIINLGGEVRFGQKVIGFDIHNHVLQGLHMESGEYLRADHVVLALGHSARDTFEKLLDAGVYMEAKPFSVGFRIEHPQSLIDRARLGPHAGHPLIGAADYKLVHHAKNGRSVYSFCMCPGGIRVMSAMLMRGLWWGLIRATTQADHWQALPFNANWNHGHLSWVARITRHPDSWSVIFYKVSRQLNLVGLCRPISPACISPILQRVCQAMRLRRFERPFLLLRKRLKALRCPMQF